MLIILAWRNIWRNKTRSLLVMLSVIIGLWAGTFTMAFVVGMYQEHMRNTILNFLSHIQIHHREFSQDRDITRHIACTQDVETILRSNRNIRSYSARTIHNVMASSPVNAVGLTAIGILPSAEDSVTSLYRKVISGQRLDPDRPNQVLIGEKTAEKLKVKLKSKIVLSFQDVNGEIVAAAFRVCGIYNSGNSGFDQSTIYVNATHMQELSAMNKTEYHEIALLLKNESEMASVKKQLQHQLPTWKIEDWRELSPELDLIINSFNIYMYIFIGIILLALSFGIINTMLMAVLERVRELGMLMAVGMKRSSVFMLIVIETIFLTIAGSPVGLLISYLSIHLSGERGIDLSTFAEGLKSYGYSSIVYPQLDTRFYFDIWLMTLLAALFAALYPAIKARGLKPVEAIRKI